MNDKYEIIKQMKGFKIRLRNLSKKVSPSELDQVETTAVQSQLHELVLQLKQIESSILTPSTIPIESIIPPSTPKSPQSTISKVLRQVCIDLPNDNSRGQGQSTNASTWKKQVKSNSPGLSPSHTAFSQWLLNDSPFSQMLSPTNDTAPRIVDVAGGKGELAFNLSCIHEIYTTILDPKHECILTAPNEDQYIRSMERMLETSTLPPRVAWTDTCVPSFSGVSLKGLKDSLRPGALTRVRRVLQSIHDLCESLTDTSHQHTLGGCSGNVVYDHVMKTSVNIQRWAGFINTYTQPHNIQTHVQGGVRKYLRYLQGKWWDETTQRQHTQESISSTDTHTTHTDTDAYAGRLEADIVSWLVKVSLKHPPSLDGGDDSVGCTTEYQDVMNAVFHCACECMLCEACQCDQPHYTINAITQRVNILLQWLTELTTGDQQPRLTMQVRNQHRPVRLPHTLRCGFPVPVVGNGQGLYKGYQDQVNRLHNHLYPHTHTLCNNSTRQHSATINTMPNTTTATATDKCEYCLAGVPHDAVMMNHITHTLDKATVLVGLHPDQATEPMIDWCLSVKKPFAVVPCCVFPSLFPSRQLPDTQYPPKEKQYLQFLDYLQSKSIHIRRAELSAQGRNIVLYYNPSDEVTDQ